MRKAYVFLSEEKELSSTVQGIVSSIISVPLITVLLHLENQQFFLKVYLVYLLELWIFLKEKNYAFSEYICLWREASSIQSIVSSTPQITTCCIAGTSAHICESVLSFLRESWVSL